jgi:hypothetical protein
MKKVILLGFCTAVLLSTSCASTAPDVINLSGKERDETISLGERQQALSIEEQKTQAEYAAQMALYTKQQTELGIEAQELCYKLKKSHKLNPGDNYQLDTANGRLTKGH